MSIKDKLDYIKETKELIKEGLNNLGEPVGEYDAFRSYPEIIDDIYNNWPRLTASGEVVSLSPTIEGPLTIDLKGNTSQTGTPTPSSTVAVNVVKGNNSIVVCGKNLLDLKDGTYSNNGVTAVVNNGEITLNGTAGTGNSFVTITLNNNLNLLNSETYTVSINNSVAIGNNNSYASLRIDLNGSLDTRFTNINNTRTVTISTTPYNDRVQIRTSSGLTYTNYVIKPMIEVGSTSTDYESYKSQSFDVNLGSIELCKIGDYQDYIYKDSGNWYLHKEVGKVVLNGEESTLTTHQFGTNSYQVKISNSISGGSVVTAMSNSFLGIPYNDRSSAGSNVIYTDSNTLVNTVIRNTSYTSLDSFKTWLSTNQPVVYFVLATATNTQITDTNIINQLNAIEEAQSYDGQTNISQVNYDKPFIITASAMKGSGS